MFKKTFLIVGAANRGQDEMWKLDPEVALNFDAKLKQVIACFMFNK